MTLRDEVIARFGDLIKEVPEAEAFIIEYETKRRSRRGGLCPDALDEHVAHRVPDWIRTVD